MMTEDRVAWHLWNWAEHMRGKGSAHMRHRNSASSGIGNSGCSDFDTMVAYEDFRCAEATDACIDSLSASGRDAVYAKHLGGPWLNHPEAQLGVFYHSAAMNIGRRLDRMGIA